MTFTKPLCDPIDEHVLTRLNAVRLIVVSFIAVGYASTMAIGPISREWLNIFGYDPSLFGLQVLFFLSGWLARRSLDRGRTIKQFIVSRAATTLPWLALYTGVVAFILYPLLCDHNAVTTMNLAGQIRYFLETVTLINPGQRMPGALDGALYASLLQGAIWSLQWGVVAYAALLIGYSLGLRHRLWYLGFFGLVLCAHMGVNGWTDATGEDWFKTIIPGLRLAMPFLLGLCAYAWKDRLPTQARGWLVLALIALSAASIHYYGLPWSYAIEPIAMTGWCALAMALLHAPIRPLENWPKLALPMFLGIWPITQLLLAMMPTITVPALVISSVCAALILAVTLTLLRRLLSARHIHRRIQPA